MADSKGQLAFIGLGAMGFGMATNLVKEGFEVTGFDIYGPTLDRFKAAGGLTAASAAEAVAGKKLVVLCVANAPQMQSVLLQGDKPVVPALEQGATLISTSTVACGYIQGLEKEIIASGRSDILFVDAPISGGAQRAAEGQLSIMAGGSDPAIEKARPVLQTMADPKKLYIVAGGVGAGSNMKMCHQVLAATQILSASEAMGFADQLGLDLQQTYDEILKSEGASFMFGHRVPRMFTDFKPIASAITIIMKDVSIVTSEARRARFAVPMSSTAEQVFFAGLNRGYGADDDSSMIRLYNEGKGKVGPVKGTAKTKEDKLALVVALLKGIHLCDAAETLAFGHRLRLDLDQVYDLCINAAGGSKALETHGPEMLKAFKEGRAVQSWSIESGEGLDAIVHGLEAAVDEAALLKMPLFLGNEALTLLRLALATGNETSRPAPASIVRVWTTQKSWST